MVSLRYSFLDSCLIRPRGMPLGTRPVRGCGLAVIGQWVRLSVSRCNWPPLLGSGWRLHEGSWWSTEELAHATCRLAVNPTTKSRQLHRPRDLQTYAQSLH